MLTTRMTSVNLISLLIQRLMLT